jgi:hypothetical protein
VRILAGTERLDEVVVRTRVEGGDLLGFRGPRREHDDRDRGPAAQVEHQVDPVTVRQSEVEQHEVRAARRRIDQAAPHAVGFENVVPFEL